MLVVDLDHTLLKTDMLHESFWSAFGRNWRTPFVSALAIRDGKAALKHRLCSDADVDPSKLPYDSDVVAYIRGYRQKGGRVALVTATNQSLAEKIASHLQIFDEVHGSSGSHNLKGVNKAEFLIERFGNEAFTYMGDAASDLPVWQAAKEIVTVNASPSVRRKTEALGKPIEHLETVAKSVRPYLRALRPHQWVKNTLVLVPMLAAHQFDAATLQFTLLAFLAFCLVASSVYVLNDLLDLSSDRSHPRKKLRPFASGAVPISHGSILTPALFLGGVLVASFVGGKFLLVLLGYYALTTAYSLFLKRKIILDICVLAGLYTIRIIAGSYAAGVDLSVWLLAFSIFFFFSLGAVKRQAELVDMAKRGALTAKGRGYHVEDLPVISTIGLASGYISVLVMALYVNSPAVQKLYVFPGALWGICCVLLYWLTRIALITHRGAMHDDPVVFAAKDRVSQFCALLILGFAIVGALV